MNKNYITVDFEDKELAKQLGAKWDNEKKSWFYYDNGKLAKISKWFPVRIKTNTETVFVRFKSGEEIIKHLGINKEKLYRLETKDKDLDGCVMVKGNDGNYNKFFMDIYSKSDLNDEEIRILEKWLMNNFPYKQ